VRKKKKELEKRFCFASQKSLPMYVFVCFVLLIFHFDFNWKQYAKDASSLFSTCCVGCMLAHFDKTHD
jgi:hypothetical protein